MLSHRKPAGALIHLPGSRLQRPPGTIDRVNVVTRERLPAEMPLEESARLCVIGDVRSFQQPPRARAQS
ncbi:MAG: hypothetical protein ACLSHG_01615 [Oscillospiraceae bacterium]